ncbi:MAG: helix-turn-helix domain-containing protein [Candidatus Gastranaerophilales bacterium]|nr:helix-turn-helix domain-containing protein [Candidatus Gastranaerophilales bacterium]
MKKNELDLDKVFQQIGTNVRKYRRKNKLSQETLAFRISSARNYIGCIERAEKHASVETLAKIAVALDIKLEDIVKGC